MPKISFYLTDYVWSRLKDHKEDKTWSSLFTEFMDRASADGERSALEKFFKEDKEARESITAIAQSPIPTQIESVSDTIIDIDV